MVNFQVNFLLWRFLGKLKFSCETSFCITIALFQINTKAISQGRQDSIKSFQLSENICSRVSKKVY